MKILKIELDNFRNAENESIDFIDGVNLLYGKNAEGKTNVLEAVYFFARGKSFRGGKDSDIVRFSQKGFVIKIDFERKDGLNSLEYRYYDGARQRFLNGVKVSAKETIGKFNAVLFCPDHLSIIKNAPSERREFLNIALSQLYSEYVLLLAEHKKLTENKNALLKSENGIDKNLLDTYNGRLSEVNAKIYIYRKNYIEKLSKSVCKTVSEISGGKENIKISYNSQISADFTRFEEIKILFERLLNENESREISAGICLFGVQRDDILFEINGKDARQFASQGQQRSIALALKIGEGEIIAAEKGESPVYLLDDVLGEFDEDRKKYVLSRTLGRQMIITACEKGDYLNLSEVNMIEVDGGRYYCQNLLRKGSAPSKPF